jgi:hypothetical protein
MYEIKVTDEDNPSDSRGARFGNELTGFDKYDAEKKPKTVLKSTKLDIEYEKPIYSPIKR